MAGRREPTPKDADTSAEKKEFDKDRLTLLNGHLFATAQALHESRNDHELLEGARGIFESAQHQLRLTEDTVKSSDKKHAELSAKTLNALHASIDTANGTPTAQSLLVELWLRYTSGTDPRTRLPDEQRNNLLAFNAIQLGEPVFVKGSGIQDMTSQNRIGASYTVEDTPVLIPHGEHIDVVILSDKKGTGWPTSLEELHTRLVIGKSNVVTYLNSEFEPYAYRKHMEEMEKRGFDPQTAVVTARDFEVDVRTMQSIYQLGLVSETVDAQARITKAVEANLMYAFGLREEDSRIHLSNTSYPEAGAMNNLVAIINLLDGTPLKPFRAIYARIAEKAATDPIHVDRLVRIASIIDHYESEGTTEGVTLESPLNDPSARGTDLRHLQLIKDNLLLIAMRISHEAK